MHIVRLVPDGLSDTTMATATILPGVAYPRRRRFVAVAVFCVLCDVLFDCVVLPIHVADYDVITNMAARSGRGGGGGGGLAREQRPPPTRRGRLAGLVDALTTTGRRELDKPMLKVCDASSPAATCMTLTGRNRGPV